jgi:diaminohydroxyphosphoribosylaminopyrimidine deaminase / 5-amino-6-(5-phosphoribosylamino)uracil reductase
MKEFYMKKAIDLANRGKGFVNPNPLVGAVIVKNDKIIGEGYHEVFGKAHAEVNAFLNATEDVTGADMYVTLEPCSHYGKTPPCALKIIEKGIKRVFVSSLDPNPLVNFKGIQLLKDAGIEVEYGILDDITKKQNEIFFHFVKYRTPFVAMKYGMTLDGKIASKTGDSKWITNELSRVYVHELRNQYSSIMVGINTILKDNPRLDTRLDRLARNPVRIVLDPNLKIPEQSYVVTTAKDQPTYVVTLQSSNEGKMNQLTDLGVKLIKQNEKEINLKQLMIDLGKMNIDSVLIEGGSLTHAKALEANIVHKVYAFVAPVMIGGKEALSPVGGNGVQLIKQGIKLNDVSFQQFEDNIMITGYVNQTGGILNEV